MELNKLKEIIIKASHEENGRKRISCPDVFKLSSEHGIDLLEITRICNEENIRISQCQLGCF